MSITPEEDIKILEGVLQEQAEGLDALRAKLATAEAELELAEALSLVETQTLVAAETDRCVAAAEESMATLGRIPGELIPVVVAAMREGK